VRLGQVSSSDEVTVYVNDTDLILAVSKNFEALQEPSTPILVRSDDSRAQRVALLIDGQLVLTETGNSISYPWDTRFLSGKHEVQAILYGGSDIIASKTVTVHIH
jgi:hypothetical protein